MKKIIIFDFDGTIADTSALIRTVYNDMAAVHDWPHVDEAEYQRLRGLGLAEAQRWAGIKSWQVPGLMREGLKRFKVLGEEVKLFTGIPELIKQLAGADNIIYVLSTNGQATIEEVLERYGIKELVTVLKRSALFAKHHAIHHLLSKYKYHPDDVWMVGDEVRDVEAGKRAGVKAAAVTWGLQSIVLLEQSQPDAIAHKPSELFNILTGPNA